MTMTTRTMLPAINLKSGINTTKDRHLAVFCLTNNDLCVRLLSKLIHINPYTMKINNRIKALVAGITVIGILVVVTIVRTSNEEEKSYSPTFKTHHHKKLSEKQWKHFDNAIEQCRIVYQRNKRLKKRSHFWEHYGVEPSVGYAAWLFQETKFNGNVVGDNGRARGYGQMHPPALSEVNKIRKKRGARTFTHYGLRGKSRARLEFFLESFHDYIELCQKRHRRKNTLDANLNAWNGGGSGGKTRETKYSGEIKSIILQYYKRKKDKEKQKVGT